MCGARSRPHILLFDESYNEHHYHYFSTIKAAKETALLLVVGTAGATNLPNQVAREAFIRDSVIIDVNIETNPFAKLTQTCTTGFFFQEPSAKALPEIVEAMS